MSGPRFTAKVKVQAKNNRTDVQTTVAFQPDYDAGRNAEWSEWTPAMSLSMTIKNELADRLEAGQTYTLTFDPTDD
jgi:hypothetical protein